ncbi:hypothetical protein [Cerasicoccus frondis]|uniref:alpha-L-rhamnosidase-related protein n=1 Tax=Cerasicoccus frondis TaxID=490090 RepID=UPI0028529E19|nr:hypothetical protein [Cerasicoccus frondis]
MSNIQVTPLYLPIQNTDASGIHIQYPIEQACWITSSAITAAPEVLRFRHTFQSEGEVIRIHVSGDQRYELSINGELICRGPDAGDLQHWSFTSLEVALPKGRVEFEAWVWSLGEHAPLAHLAREPAFIFACEGKHAPQLDTGKACWTVEVIECMEFATDRGLPGAHYIGSASVFDMRALPSNSINLTEAIISEAPLGDWCARYGMRMVARQFHPANLPLQKNIARRGGRICALLDDVAKPGQVIHIAHEHCRSHELEDWQKLMTKQHAISIPPHKHIAVLWDLEDYYCGYPALAFSGGRDSGLTVEWAESLFEEKWGENSDTQPRKGTRNAYAGKYYKGFGDTVIADGKENCRWRNYWWRSGRFLLLRIKTGNTALTLEDWHVLETGYPLTFHAAISGNGFPFAHLSELCQRGLESCAHETFVDCPYYEQLMYLGDTRIQALCLYATTQDSRLQKRSLDLFDWSRSRQNGFWTASRYPARMDQIIPPFSLIWILLLHDHLKWRGDVNFVRSKLNGARAIMDHFRTYEDDNQLLNQLPCWQFVDWCSTWDTGYPPGAIDGKPSSVINLLYLMALKSMSQLEKAVGDEWRVQALQGHTKQLGETIRKRFWCDQRSLIADEESMQSFSQHGQALALLCGIVSDNEAAGMLNALASDSSLHQTSVYFRHYLFEAAFRYKRPDLFFSGLSEWLDMLEAGAKTPWERPEPSRSDCHAWGSHPWFWLITGVAGIRPGNIGFETIHIKPQPGDLPHICAQMPHPKGEIKLNLKFQGNSCHGTIWIPSDCEGQFAWNSEKHPLKAGDNAIQYSP